MTASCGDDDAARCHLFLATSIIRGEVRESYEFKQ